MSFNFKAVVTICNDFGDQENKVCHSFHCFPIYLLWRDGTRCPNLHFLSFKPAFLLSSFTFIKRFFSSSSLSSIRKVSSAYSRLLIFLPTVLTPSCASFSPALCMMYSGYKLNKQGDYIQSWCTFFPVLNQSIVPCPVLSLLDLHAYMYGYNWVPLLSTWNCHNIVNLLLLLFSG